MDGIRFDSSGLNVKDGIEALAKQRSSKVDSSENFGIKENSSVPGESFADTLKKAVGTVNTLQKDADVKMQDLATGKSQNIHATMIAAEKADIALRLMIQVRNKVIEAYQEIMKMQV